MKNQDSKEVCIPASLAAIASWITSVANTTWDGSSTPTDKHISL